MYFILPSDIDMNVWEANSTLNNNHQNNERTILVSPSPIRIMIKRPNLIFILACIRRTMTEVTHVSEKMSAMILHRPNGTFRLATVPKG